MQAQASRFVAKVTTGDRRGAGTNARVWMQLVDSAGKTSPENHLNNIMVSDHQRGMSLSYKISHVDKDNVGLTKPDEIAYVTVWREKTPFPDDSWFLEKIEVTIYMSLLFLHKNCESLVYFKKLRKKIIKLCFSLGFSSSNLRKIVNSSGTTQIKCAQTVKIKHIL
jgi:hypothetical protein